MHFSNLAKRCCKQSPYEEYLKILHKCESEPYSLEYPENTILLNSAECTTNWKLFIDKYEHFYQLHEQDNRYGNYEGRQYLLNSLSKFLSTYVYQTNVSSNELVCTCGSGAAFELLTSCICDEGDAILVITPAYFAFERDLTLKTNTCLYYVDTHSSNFKITDEQLENTYQHVLNDGKEARMLVFTNPSNPVGVVYSEEEMRIILSFCRRHDIHIFSDEVYALSVEESNSNGFISFSKLIENDPIQDDVTIHWGLSKDFGLPGFRFASLFTHNKELLDYMKNLNYLYEIPSVAQSVISNMLEDDEFIQLHLKCYIQTVSKERQHMQNFFKEHNIPFYRNNASFFLYIDLSSYLKEKTFENEMELCLYLCKQGKVLLSPGKSFYSQTPGWFRIVFTKNSHEVTALGLERLINALQSWEYHTSVSL
ncbi:hypothetical protein WA158_002061 [Blastocystis sp. Blastoise]